MSKMTREGQLQREPIGQDSSTESILIYFITGNPGLINYYTTFFDTLRSLLPSTTSKSYTVYGENLAGFSDDTFPDVKTGHVPYSLHEQIRHIYSSIHTQLDKASSQGTPYDRVILMGHSVGAYILLEVLRKYGEDDLHEDHTTPAWTGGILLFPTVTHIAQSASGLKLTKLLKIPYFERGVQGFASIFLGWLPKGFMCGLVRLVTGMPNDATEVTVGFLKSRMGVWQALHMARDEMETITEDRWDQDIWGIERPDADMTIPRLYFYFGQNDHWVADHTRDALMEARSRRDGADPSSKPKMMIDQDGIPHGFCIRHSELVAEKVAVWIREMLET